jgi:hypothetical protein
MCRSVIPLTFPKRRRTSSRSRKLSVPSTNGCYDDHCQSVN